MNRFALFFICVMLTATGASAEMQKSQFTASNGIVVDVNSDDFAGRAEYSAPVIRFSPDNGGTGIALVARTRNAGALGELNVQGFVMYSGDWRFYGSAIFKGGAPAKFKSLGHKVGSCRYGCTLTENFLVELTPAEVEKHAEGGMLPLQIRGRSSDTAIIQVPVSYLKAVLEVAR
jgi:hypothetical protein